MANDMIAKLVERLNATGIEFVRDAWLNKAPENYGVVELNGEAGQLWADGHLIDSVWQVTVTLYVNGDSDEWPQKVQEELNNLEDDGLIDITARVTREFDYQIGKVTWIWQIRMYGALVEE